VFGVDRRDETTTIELQIVRGSSRSFAPTKPERGHGGISRYESISIDLVVACQRMQVSLLRRQAHKVGGMCGDVLAAFQIYVIGKIRHRRWPKSERGPRIPARTPL